jgi:hypothetical protein
MHVMGRLETSIAAPLRYCVRPLVWPNELAVTFYEILGTNRSRYHHGDSDNRYCVVDQRH